MKKLTILSFICFLSQVTLASTGGEKSKNVTDLGKGYQKVTWYHENGKISEEGFYLNGMKHGTWTSYSENGTKSGVVNWNLNKKDGDCFVFDENGMTKYQLIYSQNKKINAIDLTANR